MLKNCLKPSCLLVLLGAWLVACGDDTASPPDPRVTVTIPDAGCLEAGCPGAIVVCGDGVVNGEAETCDDGNTLSGDGCSDACQTETCGDGKVDVGEACDPPGTATCSARCQLVQLNCGNGKVEAAEGEQCDDGNKVNGDGCRDCRIECGDGLLDREIGEQCEPQYTPKDAAGVSTTCTSDCRLKPFCGDGKLNAGGGEECDPVNGITCVGNCKRAVMPDAGPVCTPLPDAGTDVQVPSENFIPNADFATDLAGWTAGSTVTAVHAAGQGSPAVGSAKITFTAGTGPLLSVDGISRCVTLTAGEFYEFGAQYFNPPAQPSGVVPFPVMLLYPNAACSGTPMTTGPTGAATSAEAGKWMAYKRTIDTTSAGAKGAIASLSIKLGVLVPRAKTGSLLWDDISLRSTALVNIDPNCGNCRLDKGESCDDGNRTRGDGCSSFCQRERNCGNGSLEAPETCDQGKVNFTDNSTCTPLCTNKTLCDDCALNQCRPQIDVCFGLQGLAQGGPGVGEDRSLLCGRLRQCVQATGCNGQTAIASRPTLNGMKGAFLENCYCGNAGAGCLNAGKANGSCRAEVESALETKDPNQILQRMGGTDANYPIFAAVNELLACQDTSCKSTCGTILKCGDGVVQERTEEFATTFQLALSGKPQMCTDAATPSGRGCSFEECDGSMSCDENCFLLQCGNRIKQKGEQCDDGNLVAGDGCDATCKAEFMCGDNKLDDKFGEQCDPPNAGPNCSMEQFKAGPAACGCGSTCEYKVCGNGVLQQGEDCDPPNGTTCGANCKRAGLSECMQCLLLVKTDCGKNLLEGIPGMPGFETGCLNDKPCFDLLECTSMSKCGVSIPVKCFCGLDQADVDGCENPDFQVKGPCASQTKAAYAAQFGMTPANAEAIGAYTNFDPKEGRPLSLAIAQLLAGCNLYETAGLATGLRASSVSEAVVARCVTACGAN